MFKRKILVATLASLLPITCIAATSTQVESITQAMQINIGKALSSQNMDSNQQYALGWATHKGRKYPLKSKSSKQKQGAKFWGGGAPPH